MWVKLVLVFYSVYFLTHYFLLIGKVVCKAPKNVSINRCVFIKGYYRGMGSQPYVRGEYRPYSYEFGNGSLFSFMVGYDETEENLPMMLNVSGKHGNIDTTFGLAKTASLHFSSAAFYQNYWGFPADQAESVDRSSFKYVNDRPAINLNTFKGTTNRRDVNLEFTRRDRGRGHWGDEATYEGCAKSRSGQYSSYDPQTVVGIKGVSN